MADTRAEQQGEEKSGPGEASCREGESGALLSRAFLQLKKRSYFSVFQRNVRLSDRVFSGAVRFQQNPKFQVGSLRFPCRAAAGTTML